jgi:prepilin-type N-terminal cleavage/methylation domain-containing protein
MKNFVVRTDTKNGYTLFEIMVTITIILIILIPLTRLQINILTYGRFFYNTNILQDEARRALQKFSAEVRSMTASSAGAYPIAEASATTLSFFRDADQDGLVERIHYYKDGTDLKKGIIIPTGNPLTYSSANEKIATVIHGINNTTATPVFEYFNHDYDGQTAALNQPLDNTLIRLIKINLIIGTGDANQDQMTLSTQVVLRNIKDNL